MPFLCYNRKSKSPTCGTAAFNAARNVAQTLNIPHAEQGFIAAGTPISPPTYITQHVSAQADDIIATIAKLMSLPTSQCKRSSSSYPVPSNAA